MIKCDGSGQEWRPGAAVLDVNYCPWCWAVSGASFCLRAPPRAPEQSQNLRCTATLKEKHLYVIKSFMVVVVSRMFGARFVKRTSHTWRNVESLLPEDLQSCLWHALWLSVRIWPLRDAKVSSSTTCSPSGQSNGWKQSCMQMNPRCRQRRFGFSRTDESGNRGDDSFREERETGWSLGIRAQGTVVYIQFASEGEPDYHRLHQQVLMF